jgi:hypothetical protein
MQLEWLRLRFVRLTFISLMHAMLLFSFSRVGFSGLVGPRPPYIDLVSKSSLPNVALSVVSHSKIALPELSAFASRYERGVIENGFIAVGDRGTEVLKFDKIGLLSSLGIGLGSGTAIDLAKAMKFKLSECGGNLGTFCKKTVQGLTGQWEAASYDKDGQIWMLQESTESIHVFDQAITERRSVIHINPFNPFGDSKGKNNSILGSSSEEVSYEGLYVLSSNEILLARQHSPSGVALFLIKDSPNQEDDRLPSIKQASGERFWLLPKPFSNCQLSEMVRFDSDYYLLSPSCKLIFKAKLESSSFVTVAETYSIPESLGWAEALLVLDAGHFIVGLDTGKKDIDNVYVLSADSLNKGPNSSK